MVQISENWTQEKDLDEIKADAQKIAERFGEIQAAIRNNRISPSCSVSFETNETAAVMAIWMTDTLLDRMRITEQFGRLELSLTKASTGAETKFRLEFETVNKKAALIRIEISYPAPPEPQTTEAKLSDLSFWLAECASMVP